MQYKTLGQSGIFVSRLCLGTMNFGPRTQEKDAFRIMDKAFEAGINFFDTANIYGGQKDKGRSEKIIGQWLAKNSRKRERVILATKVNGPMHPEWNDPNDEHGLSAHKIIHHLEASLKRLQTDYIDLYQMHHIDRKVTWEELWGVFENLNAQGKVVYVGSSNFAGWHLALAQAEAKKRGFLGLVAEQHKYNLLTREPELEVLPAAEYHQIGILPYSPLAAGELTAHAFTGKEGTRSGSGKVKKNVEKHRDQISRYQEICSELGEDPSHVALAWLLANPAVTSPIIGPRTEEQLDSALKALNLPLPVDLMEKLDGIFPGPGRPAPEAYAW